jgi:hypothetical protein
VPGVGTVEVLDGDNAIVDEVIGSLLRASRTIRDRDPRSMPAQMSVHDVARSLTTLKEMGAVKAG